MRNGEHHGGADLEIAAVLENWPTSSVAARQLIPQLARRLGGLRVDEEAEIAGQGLKPVGLRVRCQEIDVVLVDIAQKP